VAWTLQGVWCYVTLLPLLLLNSSDANPPLRWTDVVGVALWAVGFVQESVADWQKFAFKQDPTNKGKFINVGLWSLARYPNYGGEITVWTGFWLACTAVFSGGEWASVASPLFVSFLLLFVSGVPLQEAQAKARWGDDPAYQEYRRRTWLLLPLPGAGGKKQA
jgi:steroid 5-alpha reductase family enzyme